MSKKESRLTRDLRALRNYQSARPSVDEPCTNLGSVAIRRSRVEQDGLCNFCTSQHRTVYVVTGQGTSVRFCAACFKIVRARFRELAT